VPARGGKPRGEAGHQQEADMASISGSIKNDWLVGTAGADSIKGYGGDDFLKGGGGADRIDGGSGVDTASYLDSYQWVEVDLMSGRGWSGSAQGDTLIGIENVYGSVYGDRLSGDNNANTLSGMDGGDRLLGMGGADILQGGSGIDELTGGAGADVLDGGDGSDWAWYQESPAGITVSLIANMGLGGDAEGDTFISIENMFGSAFSDALAGDDGANYLGGLGGGDVLWGLGGADQLAGGLGQDTLIGGPGGDLFWWYSTAETAVTAAAADVVLDFNFAEGDRIHLGGIDANVYAEGNQTFTFIGTAAFSGTPGEVNYYHAGGDTYIQMQTGMSADVEGVIRLAGIHDPQASWFYL
jgi:Ca2+-binding RTX toxin-like protein